MDPVAQNHRLNWPAHDFMVALASIPAQVATARAGRHRAAALSARGASGDSRTVLAQGRATGRASFSNWCGAAFRARAQSVSSAAPSRRITYDTCTRLVDAHGIEGMLGRLYDAGVHVTLDEFKGRRPIRRGDLVIPTDARSFDNPLLARHFEARTGGSRSAGTRFLVDLDLLRHDAHYDVLFRCSVSAHGPVRSGTRGAPGCAGSSWPFASPARPSSRTLVLTDAGLVQAQRQACRSHAGIAFVSRLSGRPVPRPEHVRLAGAVKVARWLADCRSRGTPRG